MHTHTLPWTDRPLVTQNLLGGEDGIADAGISVARLIPNPWLFLEATGQVYRGESRGLPGARRAATSRYVGHLRAYQDLTESTNIDLGGSIAYGHNGRRPPTRRRGSSASTRPCARGRCAASIYTRFLARGEVSGAGASRPDAPSERLRRLRLPSSTSSRGAGPRACATTTRSAPTTPALRDTRRLARPDLLAERVQPGPRPVPPHDASAQRQPGQRAPLPVPVLDRRPRRPPLLIGGRHEDS